uniref:Uncharacterized protein n=1 Tax=Lygus hesperus TaxID=30085 RepID=A0A146MEE2_LYGHE
MEQYQLECNIQLQTQLMITMEELEQELLQQPKVLQQLWIVYQDRKECAHPWIEFQFNTTPGAVCDTVLRRMLESEVFTRFDDTLKMDAVLHVGCCTSSGCCGGVDGGRCDVLSRVDAVPHDTTHPTLRHATHKGCSDPLNFYTDTAVTQSACAVEQASRCGDGWMSKSTKGQGANNADGLQTCSQHTSGSSIQDSTVQRRSDTHSTKVEDSSTNNHGK